MNNRNANVMHQLYNNIIQDAMGCSALRAACFYGFIDVARVLLEHGADVDYQDKVGERLK